MVITRHFRILERRLHCSYQEGRVLFMRRDFFWPYWIIITLGICFVFGRAVTFGFVDFDDPGYIYQNEMVVQGFSLDLFVQSFTHVSTNLWHPLTWLSHGLDVELFGLEHPGWHHAHSIFLHVIASLLFFEFLRRRWGRGGLALMACLLFALHPLRVESVVWLSERKDVLSGAFFCAALLTFQMGLKSLRFSWIDLLTTGFALLAMMSKPSAVVLPAVLVLIALPSVRSLSDLWQLGLKILFPILLSIAVICISLGVQSHGSHQELLQGQSNRVEDLMIALLALREYLELTIWPIDLALNYSPPSQVTLLTLGLVCLLLATPTVVCLYLWRRSRCQAIIGWFWFVGALVPVLGFVELGHIFVADRYSYLPHLGLVFTVGCLVSEWLSLMQGRRKSNSSASDIKMTEVGRKATMVILSVVVVVLAARSAQQTGLWENSSRLYTLSYERNPKHFLNSFNYAALKFREGQLDLAEKAYRESVAANSGFHLSHIFLAEVLIRKDEFGSQDEIRVLLARAQEIRPEHPQLKRVSELLH